MIPVRNDKSSQIVGPVPMAVVVATAVVTLLSGCGGPGLNSRWADEYDTVDRQFADWDGAERGEQNGLSIALQNDSSYLYISVITTDEERIDQIRRTGLTVWFDQFGERNRLVGIQYPSFNTGREAGLSMADRRNPDRKRNERPARPIARQANAIAVIPAGEKKAVRWTHAEAEAQGIAGQIDDLDTALVWQLRVPLAEQGKYRCAVGSGWVRPDFTRNISIGLESGRPFTGRDDRPGPSGHPGGGMGGMMNVAGGPPPGGMPLMSGGVEVWANFQLAAPPTGKMTEANQDGSK